jgi:hypothetical protein
MTLTTAQIEALRLGQPVMLSLPEVGRECVLIRGDVYDCLTKPLETDADFDPVAGYPLTNDVMAEDGANDPWLESYRCQ